MPRQPKADSVVVHYEIGTCFWQDTKDIVRLWNPWMCVPLEIGNLSEGNRKRIVFSIPTGPLPKMYDLRTILSSRKSQRTRFQKTTWAGYHTAIKGILSYSHKYWNIFIIIIILQKNHARNFIWFLKNYFFQERTSKLHFSSDLSSYMIQIFIKMIHLFI